MLTQEERLSQLERSMAAVNGAISDINHNETMLLGLVTKQEEIIREVNARLAALNEHIDTFEQSVNSRLDIHDKRFDRLETRLDRLETKFDEHTTLLTQILARLPEKP